MRSTKLFAVVVVLSLAFVCLITGPVLSIEDPWDVDGNDGQSGDAGSDSDGDTDSTGVLDEDFMILGDLDQGFNPDWFTGLMFRFSCEVATKIATYFGETSTSGEVLVRKVGGNGAAR